MMHRLAEENKTQANQKYKMGDYKHAVNSIVMLSVSTLFDLLYYIYIYACSFSSKDASPQLNTLTVQLHGHC